MEWEQTKKYNLAYLVESETNGKSKMIKSTEKIKVGLVGAGYMGAGILNIISHAREMEVIALFDEEKERGKSVRKNCASNSVVISEKIEELCSMPSVDIVVDGTPDPEIGAEVAFWATRYRKDIVSVNIEADATIGHSIKQLAKQAGTVYSVTLGDEPGELMKFYNHLTFLGFEVVAAGKGKNNPLDRSVTPQTVNLPDNGISAEQVTSFVDGSKTMFEMACLSNATGLVPDCRGMHGPKAQTIDLTSIFRPKEEGGILSSKGVVDYITGSEISGGIFIIVFTENKRLQSDLRYLNIGTTGPYYLYYQPFHNWFLDIPLSIYNVTRKGQVDIVSLDVPTSEVIAVAKRDLKRGEILDGVGGYDLYGLIEKKIVAQKEGFFPFGLAKGSVLHNSVKNNFPLTMDDVEINSDSRIVKLWKAGNQKVCDGKES
ncbi:MAG: Gfo/Idh/MocA family oxidoreductase [Planctomycetes bacterium]|nr:Gfo/Idh/MocA family oxidoreductase [Planctomycetota bacterium]